MNAMARRPRSVLRASPLALVCALGMACSGPVDSSENKLPYRSEEVTPINDTSSGGGGETGTDASSTACDCLTVGRWYRFDSLALTTIDGKDHPVIPTLNGLWGSDIAALELDIMLEVKAVSAASVTMRVMNGARIDGTQDICSFPATAVEVVFPRNGCSLETSAESAFNVYAGTETYPKTCSTTLPVKNAIPVARARLEGTVSDDCGAILTGKVPSGGLGQNEIAQVCTCLLLPGKPAEDCGLLDPSFNASSCVGCNPKYQSLGALLTAFGEPDWSCQTESGTPAACITADFTAAAIGAPIACDE